MLLNFVIIIIGGALLASLFEKIHLPGLVGMILFGILISPNLFDLISPDFYAWSAELRQFALIIILLRAGLTLDVRDLKQNGRSAILLCFLPALFEITAIGILAPLLFNIPLADALVMGTVLAAVSPAVIVPRMIHLIDHRYGTKKGIPQMILAGSSADDIFVIILFSSFLTMAQTGQFDFKLLWHIPISIISGLLLGYLLAAAIVFVLKKWQQATVIEVMIILALLVGLVNGEDWINTYLPFSALLAVFSFGLGLQRFYAEKQTKFAPTYGKFWQIAQIILFVLVGTTVDLSYIQHAGLSALVLIIGALLIRAIGVWLSLLGTSLTKNEKIFSVISYMPKATVQAAIGAIPLSVGLASGEIILAVAVIAILTTAPIGAFAIDHTYKRLLVKN